MSGISVEEWQLVSFFETEPELLDPDEPWCFNDAVYRFEQSPLSLSFAIAPGYCDVRIIIEQQGQRLYELNAVSAKDVRYTDERGEERLEILFHDGDSLVLRVKPRIELVHTSHAPRDY